MKQTPRPPDQLLWEVLDEDGDGVVAHQDFEKAGSVVRWPVARTVARRNSL